MQSSPDRLRRHLGGRVEVLELAIAAQDDLHAVLLGETPVLPRVGIWLLRRTGWTLGSTLDQRVGE